MTRQKNRGVATGGEQRCSKSESFQSLATA